MNFDEVLSKWVLFFTFSMAALFRTILMSSIPGLHKVAQIGLIILLLVFTQVMDQRTRRTSP